MAGKKASDPKGLQAHKQGVSNKPKAPAQLFPKVPKPSKTSTNAGEDTRPSKGQLGKGKSAEGGPSPLRNVAFPPPDEALTPARDTSSTIPTENAGPSPVKNAEFPPPNETLSSTPPTQPAIPTKKNGPPSPLTVNFPPNDESASRKRGLSPLPPADTASLPPTQKPRAGPSDAIPNLNLTALQPQNAGSAAPPIAVTPAVFMIPAIPMPLPVSFPVRIASNLADAGVRTSNLGFQLAPPDPFSTGNEELYSLARLAEENRNAWLELVGLYFVTSNYSPERVFGPRQASQLANLWRVDVRRKDIREKNPLVNDGYWRVETASITARQWMDRIWPSRAWVAVLERAIQMWASVASNEPEVKAVLQRADWTTTFLWDTPEYAVITEVLRMRDGEERDDKIKKARAESPDLFQVVVDEPFSGCRKFKSLDGNNVYQYRKRGSTDFEDPPPFTNPTSSLHSPKRIKKMDGSFGRPTQIHAVPPEERAFDSKGNRLPWGLEWHEDHPNARGQRRQPIETGPFGKSNRRKASSRTRTATPAKKENPNIEFFGKALQHDAEKNARLQNDASGMRMQAENNPPQHSISANKQPTQVILHGYSSESQWAALDTYEKASYGIICEDYARDPPLSSKKYQSAISSYRPSRPLTKAEKKMAFNHVCGDHWVKVTFDSAEAAERALEMSPIQIYGHWVYAEKYYGKGPERDEPIPLTNDERELRRPRNKHNTVGPSYAQRSNSQLDATATLPRSFAPEIQNGTGEPDNTSPSSTATSGTATGVEYPDLRRRQPASNQQDPQTPQPPPNPQMMRHFPDIPKTILKPASEAFLPQLTWWEKQVQWLAGMGLIPGEIIGNGIPITEDGRLDLAHASFYWKIFYWIDTHFGTDFCGLKDDD